MKKGLISAADEIRALNFGHILLRTHTCALAAYWQFDNIASTAFTAQSTRSQWI